MNQVVLFLIIGFIIGAGATLFVWWSRSSSRQKRDQQALNERNQTIRSIAEMMAEVDSVITAAQRESTKESTFRKTLVQKIDSIDKILKPSMHILDVYFVKYVERKISEYSSLLSGVSEPSEVMTFQDESVPEKTLESEIAKTNLTTPGNISFDDDFDTMSAPLIPVETAQLKEPIVEDTKFEDDVLNKTNESDASSCDVVKEEISETVIVDEEVLGEVVVAQSEVAEDVSASQPEPQPEALHIDEPKRIDDTLSAHMGDEEFSMETIMDVDVSRIPMDRVREKIEDIKIIDKSIEPESEIVVNKQSNSPFHAGQDDELSDDALVETIMIRSDPIKEIMRKEGIKIPEGKLLRRKVAPEKMAFHEDEHIEPPTIFAVEPHAPEEKMVAAADDDKNKEGITGDDVADKIDAFFKL